MVIKASDLFGELPPRPRAPRQWRMHVIDAGENPYAGTDCEIIAKFQCARCGAEADWMPIKNITETKRGIPCEHCNKTTNQGDV